MSIGIFYLKFEKRSDEKHSEPEVILGYRGWIFILNLPLRYGWGRDLCFWTMNPPL